jgi:prephenate dehydrogenase
VAWQPRTAGLIGGEGRMGALFARLLAGRGLRVRASGEHPDPGYGGLVAESDLVVVTVPIAATVPVIRRIAPFLRAGQLLCDLTSVKREPVAAMLETPAWVIGAHPLFGPMPSVAGQNVVVCPERPGPCLEWFTGFIAGHGMTPVTMTPQGHDEAMAFIQGLTHFLNITFARTLQTRHADLEALLRVCSPVYQVFFAVLSRILSGDPALYGQIQLLNRENVPVLREFLANAQDLLGTVEGQDWDGFHRVFEESAAYLGDFKAVAREESNFLIEQMRAYLEAKGKAK